MRDVPPGVKFLQKVTDHSCPNFVFNRQTWYRASVLILTYMAYTCYHLSRKPISVVKTVLHQNCTGLTPPPGVDPNTENWCDWKPFDGSDVNASELLGELDSAFLFAYAIAMFASGFVAERFNLRYFLALGMIMSGIYSCMLGLAKIYNIHTFRYFFLVQAAAGIFQTTGWPGVIAVLGNWCGKSKRGVTFGIWNSHTSIGNILGSLIAAAFVETDWSLSFIYPGLIIISGGVLIFLFLVVSPSDVGCSLPDEDRIGTKHRRKFDRSLQNQVANRGTSSGGSSETDDADIIVGEQEVQRRITERVHLLRDSVPHQEERPIGFLGACKIPGVIEFSLSLFFSKLVSYTFLYWLPLYVQHSTTMGATYSADLSVLFDVGGIIGAIAAGAISDYTNMSATTCVGMLFNAIPMLFIYQHFGAISIGLNIVLLVIVGILVNGPYALITTAVSADLGTHPSLEGNSKALATVAAIIDGTGSIGAAVGPLLAGFVSRYGWDSVFYMLMISDVLALLLLLRLVKQEIQRCRQSRRLARIE
ncbi:hypothetical protein RN001_010701 [Aquatica leii]|uniref:Sugar phosphate exchanger 3 n=1 Tax=Aquatica leii TaxID=1421715 RepID=A0AAN7Q3H4_9COLE|nr:hypothetical protein RN001_010701 [Aquatica leii]